MALKTQPLKKSTSNFTLNTKGNQTLCQGDEFISQCLNIILESYCQKEIQNGIDEMHKRTGKW